MILSTCLKANIYVFYELRMKNKEIFKNCNEQIFLIFHLDEISNVTLLWRTQLIKMAIKDCHWSFLFIYRYFIFYLFMIFVLNFSNNEMFFWKRNAIVWEMKCKSITYINFDVYNLCDIIPYIYFYRSRCRIARQSDLTKSYIDISLCLKNH